MPEFRASDTFQDGEVLNETYQIEAVLGRGGTSEVFRARHLVSERTVAIKVLNAQFSSNDDYVSLMRREDEMRAIRHEAVVQYADLSRFRGHIYLVMEYVEGPSVQARMKAGGISAPDLLTLASRVGQGLAATHARNVIHRDLKPENILLRNNDPADPVIIDFGIAKDNSEGAATIVGGEFAGTYAYAAPEQFAGQADARTDLYSLGASLLAAFRGVAPKLGSNPMQVIEAKKRPLDVTGVPEPLGSIIARLTHPDPVHRFQTAIDLVQAIDPAFSPGSSVGTSAPKTPTALKPAVTHVTEIPSRPERPKRRRGGWVMLVVLLALGGGGVAAWQMGYADDWLNPLPTEDTYRLTLSRPAGGPLTVTGNAPSETAATQLGRSADSADLTLARGAPDRWADEMQRLIDILAPLDEVQADVTNQAVRVTGLTEDRSLFEATRRRLQAFGAGPWDVTQDLTLGPRILPVERVQEIVDADETCGPLELVDPPATHYELGATITVSGVVAQETDRVRLISDLGEVIGDRTLVADLTILNAALCTIDARLPSAPPGPVSIEFSWANRAGVNLTGTFSPGDNPIIDLVFPEDVDGHVWVSIVDVTGLVFNLLPTIHRPEDRLQMIGEVEDGRRTVRVAFALADRFNDPGKIAFTVDGTLGTSRVIVLIADEPLFAGTIRPQDESVGGFADALEQLIEQGDLHVRSLTTRVLTTR